MALRLIEERKATATEIELFKKTETDFNWFADHYDELKEKFKGKYVAIVNKEPFIGDSIEEVEAKIQTKHPGIKTFIWKIPYKDVIWIL